MWIGLKFPDYGKEATDFDFTTEIGTPFQADRPTHR